jgi:hypothetical protein
MGRDSFVFSILYSFTKKNINYENTNKAKKKDVNSH